ncbi:uncharacterized protein LOC124293529 [Neodiprion lecontei]|uniref:Uncharacterized protein LOC124293529 n=1 Tax=Neodiprion lecontei TaxID=441921 RepID=A0ABM3FRG5_NEOLC|nr:uncharacterized protein LOC124293529 [Neodiprion lecontei]
MADYFIQHPHIATGKFQSLRGKSDLAASWEQLVAELNKMGKDEKGKDVKSWKSTWRDNKTTVSQKVAKIRANRSRTGNLGDPRVKLTEREEKIMGIVGFDDVEGVECPDAFPEQQLNVIELLAEGDESILDEDGSILTWRDYVEASALDYTNIEFLENFDGGEATLEEGSSIPEENTDAALPPPPPPPPAITPSPADALAKPGPSGLNQQGTASRVTRPNSAHSWKIHETTSQLWLRHKFHAWRCLQNRWRRWPRMTGRGTKTKEKGTRFSAHSSNLRKSGTKL